MRVLLVTNMYPTASTPSAGAFVAAQAESLRRIDVEIDVLHLPRLELGRSVYRNLGRRVCGLLRAQAHDLVHVAYGGVMAAAVTRAVRDRPVIITFHGSDLIPGRGRSLADRISRRLNVSASHRAARGAAGIVVVSRELYDALPASVDRSSVWIVPNGVDLSRFRPRNRRECRLQLGWSSDGTHVLFPASPSRPEKQYSLAAAAIELLESDGLPVELHALDRVPYDEVPIWLGASDAILITSAHEGSPVVVKESLACNVPVVSVDVGDVAERIADVDGCFIAAPTPQDLAEKLRLSLAHDRLENGRERVAELSLERVAVRIRDIYSTVTGAAAQPSPA